MQKGDRMETTDTPKLRRVRRLDSIRLDVKDRTYFTEEGYLVDHPILTSCGIFEYTNPDGGIRRELRLPEHVFAEESLKTYKGKPIIITHEAGVVNKGNVDREQIGTILTDGCQDGDDVRAEIIIHNTDAMKDCGLKELSLGYSLDLVEEPGEWNGKPYDAIQTNIVINHLALVANARAGEQARLNIDSSDCPELKGSRTSPMPMSDGRKEMYYGPHAKAAGAGNKKKHKGGNDEMQNKKTHSDSIDMTPEELMEAIKAYKASNSGNMDNGGAVQEKTAGVESGSARAGTGVADQNTQSGSDKELELAASTSEAENKDDGINRLVDAVKELLAALKGNDGTEGGSASLNGSDEDGEFECCQEDNDDSSDDRSLSQNNDSAESDLRQRLEICRIGDKLHIDGLEEKNVMEAKKAVITKVLPMMRLDGKSNAYVDAAFDIAVCEVKKRRDVSYQRKQMSALPAKRTDSCDGESMASSARRRMIEREGGKEE